MIWQTMRKLKHNDYLIIRTPKMMAQSVSSSELWFWPIMYSQSDGLHPERGYRYEVLLDPQSVVFFTCEASETVVCALHGVQIMFVKRLGCFRLHSILTLDLVELVRLKGTLRIESMRMTVHINHLSSTNYFSVFFIISWSRYSFSSLALPDMYWKQRRGPNWASLCFIRVRKLQDCIHRELLCLENINVMVSLFFSNSHPEKTALLYFRQICGIFSLVALFLITSYMIYIFSDLRRIHVGHLSTTFHHHSIILSLVHPLPKVFVAYKKCR